MSILLIGCSSGRYLVADRLMKANDYQSALQEYTRIIELKGTLAMSRDIRALTGAMIAYYQLGNHKNSFAIAKHILSIEKYHGCAIFYAAMNLEMMNKKSLAIKIYRYYKALSRFDPFYNLTKAKFKLLVQDEMEKRAQMAIKMESSISMDQIDENTVAVLYFLNVINDPEWNSLSKGLAEMIITDLSQVESLKVLERIYLQKLIEEMQLGMTGLTEKQCRDVRIFTHLVVPTCWCRRKELNMELRLYILTIMSRKCYFHLMLSFYFYTLTYLKIICYLNVLVFLLKSFKH